MPPKNHWQAHSLISQVLLYHTDPSQYAFSDKYSFSEDELSGR